ncbi:protein Shroom2-like isoform X1 [Pristis pectinata]|uniref:protein Shroom2-like isoform X1 n=1 Tax=Pristis pectinata TaxID=685728 RepID=UPI00223CAC60|nr:protein Shroom2-like isoform X1 [Pristis pectinata]
MSEGPAGARASPHGRGRGAHKGSGGSRRAGRHGAGHGRAEGGRGQPLVEVALSGGAPWGFTLRGGQEHREPLLVTKIEEGSKAAAVGKLQIGDELVSINDVVLTGFRQEAICLVKGSHRSLKMVVRRRNEPVGRPHSWHSTKFTDSPQEPATMQLSSSGVCSSWHSRYHTTSSSNSLSDPWDQPNLHRISHQFSSLGSMDSLDQPPALSLSPAKSNTSVEQAAQPSRRDSAYSSFSTNCSTPDYSLSSSRSDNGSSTENVLSRVGYWEAGWQASSRQGQALPDQTGLEERQCHPSPVERHSPRPDEQASFRPPRASLGPVWHVPEKRVPADSRGPKRASPPSPPPPPIRSDSYAATKVHEGGGQARSKPHLRGDREAMEGGGGWRNQACSPRLTDVPSPASLDGGASLLPPHHHLHRRQRSDELTPQRADRAPRGVEVTWRQDQALTRASPAPPTCPEDSPAPDGPGQSRYFCLTSRPPHQPAAVGQSRLRVESWDGQKGAAYPPAPASRPPRHLPEGGRGRAGAPEEAGQKPDWVGQRGGSGGIDNWASGPRAGEPGWPGPGAIYPEQTPILHSLAQDSHKLQAEPGQAARQLRRSDRFATALRNEIQMKRAQLQKSRSAAALTGTPEAEETIGRCRDGEPVAESAPWPDGGNSPSSSYTDGLKEAQARVLRATSFQRRDLGPPAAPLRPPAPPPCPGPTPRDGPQPQFPGNPPAIGRAAGNQPARVGGRKRLTQEQRLRSYSEPGKMNEVGAPEGGMPPPQPGPAPLASFADRRLFFEGGIKAARPSAAHSRPAPRPSPQLAPGEVAQWKGRASGPEMEDRHPESEGRSRAASLGLDGWLDGLRAGPHQASGWSQASARAHPSEVPERTGPGGDPDTREREAEPQRLGTFAEYQATWREQRKPSEARSSGRYHSADNILDQSFQQPAKPQYVHERSRSSPTTDFYLQDIPIEVRRCPEGFQKKMTHLATEAGASAPRRRHLGSGSSENNSEGRQFQTETELEQTWPERNAQAHEQLPRERHGRPVSMLSGRHYPEEAELQAGRRAEGDVPDPCPQDWELSQPWATVVELENPAEGAIQAPTSGTGLMPGSEASAGSDPQEARLGGYPGDGAALSGNTQGDVDSAESSAFHCLPKPVTDASRSPSPQFAPQRLTDKPPLTLEDDGLARIEKVTENNTTVKKVPIKIVRSESQTEKENRHNLLNNVDLIGIPNKEQPKSIGSREHPYSLFAAYSRQEQERLADADQKATQSTEAAGDLRAGEGASPASDCPKTREKSVEDIKSEELVREIVVKDRSLADILNPNSKMKTTMDLMEGIFPKDETFLEEAQQRRKLLPRPHSPKVTEEREEETAPIGVSLTTSSTYYSTSAPKAELLNKLKDMQQQMEGEEDSEDELNNDLTEKKQELIDSISKKLQVLREARESLQDDIQANNLLGDEVEAVVKKVCKPNEFDKFRMFIGDLDKVVNLLLSLSGRLARVENALNTLEESASPEERRTLTQKQKLLTRQHEDAKELKENLDRRERLVFDILSSYLTDELLQDYEHFVKMKSALTIEQRELEDKIKLGEEQLKCLLESLPLDCKPK